MAIQILLVIIFSLIADLLFLRWMNKLTMPNLISMMFGNITFIVLWIILGHYQ